jgi:hypothetical protein
MVGITGQTNSYYTRENHFDSDRMAGSVAVWRKNDSSSETAIPSALSLEGEQQDINVTAPSLSFGELLDVVNPLHHLPVVGDVYRGITNDKISAVARVTGGAIYGGAIGGAVSIVNAAVEEHTGQLLGGALKSGATGTPKHYTFDDEQRTAGMKPREVIAEKASQDDIFAQMNESDVEPVTEVLIAKVEPVRTRNQWSFNS